MTNDKFDVISFKRFVRTLCVVTIICNNIMFQVMTNRRIKKPSDITTINVSLKPKGIRIKNVLKF